MKLEEFANKTVGIYGGGLEGNAVKDCLSAKVPSAKIFVFDDKSIHLINKAEIIVKSPGVSLYKPVLQEVIQKGIAVTSGTNIFLANKTPDTKVIALTGTKGKSTTSSLLVHTLKKMGKTVELGGNIGIPLVQLTDTRSEYVVAELSSYQCADITGNIDIGILNNLYPEHLEWHGSHQRYYLDKINMINQAKTAVLNAQDKKTLELLPEKDALWFNDERFIHYKDGFFYDGATRLFARKSVPLIGEHNALNVCAVLTVLKLLNLDIKQAGMAMQDFKPLAHRLQDFGNIEDWRFIDDSISTTPETAIAALKSFPTDAFITLIAGGLDRGQNYTELANFIAANPRFATVTLPETGKKLYQLVQEKQGKSYSAENMAMAVNIAKEITPIGGIILLSPAAASYNTYKNFIERGNDFLRCAKGEDINSDWRIDEKTGTHITGLTVSYFRVNDKNVQLQYDNLLPWRKSMYDKTKDLEGVKILLNKLSKDFIKLCLKEE